jgi:hypothetical protein
MHCVVLTWQCTCNAGSVRTVPAMCTVTVLLTCFCVLRCDDILIYFRLLQ